MVSIISPGEKCFIVDGIRSNIRVDGRSNLEACSFTYETDILEHCLSSCEVELHGTRCLVGIKLEIGIASQEKNGGRIECSVRCSSGSGACFPEKNIEEMENINYELSRNLEGVFGSNPRLTKELGIKGGRVCWIVYVDALVTADNGNIFDCLCLATKIGLRNLEIREVRVREREEGEEEERAKELEVEEEEMKDNKQHAETNNKKKKKKGSEAEGVKDVFYEIIESEAGRRLELEEIPMTLSCALVGECWVVDPRKQEELCSDVVIAVSVYGSKSKRRGEGTGSKVKILKQGQSCVTLEQIQRVAEHVRKTKHRWEALIEAATTESCGVDHISRCLSSLLVTSKQE